MFEETPITFTNIKAEANRWLINNALPLWYDKGVDWRRGGFFESLEREGLSCPVDFKRLRVLTRQIYVFSAGCRLNQEYCKSAVIHGLDFLLTKARVSGGGFSSRLSNDGDILEGDLDLYDLAFCLFSLAHAYRLLSDASLKDEAVNLITFVIEHFSHASGGFSEGLRSAFPRRQNPHMHLLEAVLEWRVLSDDVIFADISDALVELFMKKFYYSEMGVLIEYFDDELRPLSGPFGIITEPGHHFEWVWLLNKYTKVTNSPIPVCDRLYNFARTNGINLCNGLLWGEVNNHGVSLGDSVRLWPHAEWLKAELVTTKPDHQLSKISESWMALSRFLDYPQPGLWHETYDHMQKNFVPSASPASSLYHIVLAIECLNDYKNYHMAQ